MKMDGQIRVRTKKEHGQLYNDLKGIACTDFHELFFVCACLGYKNGAKKPLGKSGEERFWSRTITPPEWSCFYAMLLRDTLPNMDYSVVKDDKEVLSQIEQYANAGIEILAEKFLGDYLVKNTREPRLDPTTADELTKSFLYFVWDQAELEYGSPL